MYILVIRDYCRLVRFSLMPLKVTDEIVFNVLALHSLSVSLSALTHLWRSQVFELVWDLYRLRGTVHPMFAFQ